MKKLTSFVLAVITVFGLCALPMSFAHAGFGDDVKCLLYGHAYCVPK